MTNRQALEANLMWFEFELGWLEWRARNCPRCGGALVFAQLTFPWTPNAASATLEVAGCCGQTFWRDPERK